MGVGWGEVEGERPDCVGAHSEWEPMESSRGLL